MSAFAPGWRGAGPGLGGLGAPNLWVGGGPSGWRWREASGAALLTGQLGLLKCPGCLAGKEGAETRAERAEWGSALLPVLWVGGVEGGVSH